VSDEPTVEVKLDPCPDCGGTGNRPVRVETAGRVRSEEAGGLCERCRGKARITRQVPLSELRHLLDHPEEFR
jgi:RecJ-like exonuclease